MNARTLAALLATVVALTTPSVADQIRLPQKAPLPDAKSEPAGDVLPEKAGDVPVPEAKSGAETIPQQLPGDAPIPDPKSEPAGNIAPQNPGDVPIPEPKADATEPITPENPVDAPTPDPKAEAAGNIPPEKIGDVPLPEPKPDHDHVDTPGEPETPKAAETKPAPPPDPRSGTQPLTPMPAVETKCRERLQSLGVAFEERPAEASQDGCSLPYPLSVKTLGDGVALAPPALMNCATAETAARFAKSVIAPAAKREFGATLKSIDQASAYVCRPRNGTSKLSEHAFGNALDIASFKLSDGRTLAVDEKTAMIRFRPDNAKPAATTSNDKSGGTTVKKSEPAAQPTLAPLSSPETRFMNTVRTAACGPFKTVLGPGSNADHATHFHLDLAPRKHGGTVCE